jgi:ubiquinone/menaquinone biosynthesis C-methylase UbiE
MLAGIDVNRIAIERAKTHLPNIDLRIAKATELPFPKESFDLVLCDAVLIYVPPEEILAVAMEIDRVAIKGAVLVEWYGKSRLGSIKDYHWARDYAAIFEGLGFEVETIKLTEESWPSAIWKKNGRVFVCRRRYATGEKKS